MKRSLILVFAVLMIALNSNAQYACFINPSLEGTPQATAIPPNWSICNGIGDIEPGFWGINLPPSNGISYVGLLRIGNSQSGYYEAFGQLLSNCLQANVQYFMTFDIAHTNYYSTAGPNGCYSACAIYGGNTSCALTEKLWSSGPFVDSTWQPQIAFFTPTSNWCYITIVPDWINSCGSGTGYINLLIDNLSCINTASYGVNVNGTNVSCYNMCNGTANAFAYSGNQPYTYSWSPGGMTTSSLTGLCPGNYTVVVTDATLATVTDSITISQPSQTPFAVSVGNTLSCNAYCNGMATANITGGSPGFTCIWQPNQDTGLTTFSLCPGTYTVTVTDTNGCVVIDSGTVTQMPPITASIVFNNDTLWCVPPAYAYQWVLNSVTLFGETNQYLVPTQIGGVYSVVAYDSAGCPAISPNYVYTSVGDDPQLWGVSVYPNPSDGKLNVSLNLLNSGNAIVEIKNIVGETIRSLITTLPSGHSAFLLDLSDVPKGIYFMMIKTNGSTINKRIVIR